MTTELRFYTTEGCHLCEEAHSLLLQLQRQYPEKFQIETVDIATSDKLVEQYGTRIPVVVRKGRKDDIGWPFGYDDLVSLLAEG